MGCYIVYLLSFNIFSDKIESSAFQNAERIIELERSIGLLWEPVLQNFFLDLNKWVFGFFYLVYFGTFWPVIFTSAFILYRTNRTNYLNCRNIILISYGIALTIFLLFPVAPPKMIPGYYLDVEPVFGSLDVDSVTLERIYNAYAAVPSLHFTWTLLFGFIFFQTGKLWMKVIGLTYPTLTFIAIIVTGNHFIIDSLVGALVILISGVLFKAIHQLQQRMLKRK